MMAIAVIVILHVVGLFGMSSERWQDLFCQLSPVTLLLTTILVLFHHRKWDQRFLLFAAICITVGFGIELAGVHTGVVFGGAYSYGPNLGPKVAGVPLMMGLLWLLLTVSAGTLVEWIASQTQLLAWLPRRAALGASLMVLLDFTMEQLAAPLGYWEWGLDAIGSSWWGAAPALNYLTWFLVSFVLLIAYDFLAIPARRNPVAAIVLPVQMIFFLLLQWITFD